MNDEERDALLVKLDTNNGWIVTMLTNHLKHHWAFTIVALGTALSAVIGLVITLLTK